MMDDEAGAPRAKKSRRYTAEPQRVSESKLVGTFVLPHGAGRPEAEPLGTAKAPSGTEAGTEVGTHAGADAATHARTPVPTADPVFEQTAAEDDPRRWGDAEDDLGDWMKSQRPPHWS